MGNDLKNKSNDKVRLSGYISLILVIIFFSGIFQSAEGPMKFFDFTNVLGTFGTIGEGELATTFRGLDGTGVKDGWLFAINLAPAVIFAIGVVQIVEDLDGLRAANKLMTPLLRPLLGIPGSTGLALIASLQSTDAGAALTKSLYDSGELNEKQRLIFVSFQYSAGGFITNFFSSGAALFGLIDVAVLVPMLIILVFKFVAGNITRLIFNFIDVDSETVEEA